MKPIHLLLLLATPLVAELARAELIVDFPTSTTWVTVNQNGQGATGGQVPWSLDSPRSPAANYTGPVYYGGATSSLSIGAAGIMVANGGAAVDYIQASAGSGAIGDWVAVAPTFLLNDTYALTNVTVTPRTIGSLAQQTNLLRLIIQQDAQLYASDVRGYNPAQGAITYTASSLATLTWYAYDPAASLTGIGGLAAGVSATNITALGVLIYNENTAARSPAAGLSGFVAQGVLVPEPTSVVLLGLGALLLARFSRK